MYRSTHECIFTGKIYVRIFAAFAYTFAYECVIKLRCECKTLCDISRNSTLRPLSRIEYRVRAFYCELIADVNTYNTNLCIYRKQTRVGTDWVIVFK